MSAAATEWVTVPPRLLRRAAWIAYPLAILCAVLAVAVPTWLVLRLTQLLGRFDGILVGLGVFLALSKFLVAFSLWRSVRWLAEQRFGVTPTHFVFPRARWLGLRSSAEERAPWRDVYFDGSRVLAGRRVLTTRAGVRVIHDLPRLEKAMAPHLPPGHRVTQRELTRLAWRGGAFNEILSILALGLAIGTAVIQLTRIYLPLLLSP